MAQWLNYLKKIRPYNIQKGFRYLKHYGLREFLVRLSERSFCEIFAQKMLPGGLEYEK